MSDIHLEPERYELTEPARYVFDLPEVDRRDFLRIFSVLGGGLVVAASLPASAPLTADGAQGQQQAADLEAWIHIDEHGKVTAFTGKVEIGQNIRTSLSQVVADELRVPLDAIAFVMGDTDLTPFDQGTFGSRTTPAMAPLVARAAASARELLIDRAAAAWNTDRGTLRAADGRISGADGRAVGYGDLMKGQRLTGRVTVSPAARQGWVIRSTPVRKVGSRDIVVGRHTYTPDLTRPGMMVGRIVRPPAVGAKPIEVDDARAKSLPGVTVVRDGELIGVVAPTARLARQAVEAMRVTWSPPPAQPSSKTIFEHLKQTASTGVDAGETGGRGRGSAPRVTGDVAAARANAARTFASSYRIPYIAHVPMEPRTAVAEWTNGKVTVWTGTQRPFGVRTEVANAFRLAEDQVRVIVPDFGSGYGGKHSGEQAIEAARLARAAGQPVKLVYQRDEEFAFGYLRPAGVIDIAAGVDRDGRLTFWEYVNYNSGSAGLPTPYAIPNQHVAFRASDSPLRQGSYRGLAATANHYAREMHMDAIARALKIDPVAFRLTHLEDVRMRAVLEAAAKHSGWPKPSRAGRGLGIACGTEKGSYVATAAEVTKTADGFNVDRLVVVFECGAIVNPDGLHNQVEGAVVQGLGGALFEKVEFADGKILNGTMAQYRVPRFKDVPPIDVVLLDRPDLPSAGAGETPIVCVAPAIGSAVRTFGAVEDALPVKLRA